MGTCKDELTPPKDDKKPKKGFKDTVMGAIKRKKPKVEPDVEVGKAANTVAEHLDVLDTKYQDLIIAKRKDLESESGEERVNAQKLAILTTMARLNDQQIELAADYNDL